MADCSDGGGSVTSAMLPDHLNLDSIVASDQMKEDDDEEGIAGEETGASLLGDILEMEGTEADLKEEDASLAEALAECEGKEEEEDADYGTEDEEGDDEDEDSDDEEDGEDDDAEESEEDSDEEEFDQNKGAEESIDFGEMPDFSSMMEADGSSLEGTVVGDIGLKALQETELMDTDANPVKLEPESSNEKGGPVKKLSRKRRKKMHLKEKGKRLTKRLKREKKKKKKLKKGEEDSKVDPSTLKASERRRNIRKILGEKDLEQETLDAQKEELERQQRLMEQKKQALSSMATTSSKPPPVSSSAGTTTTSTPSGAKEQDSQLKSLLQSAEEEAEKQEKKQAEKQEKKHAETSVMTEIKKEVQVKQEKVDVIELSSDSEDESNEDDCVMVASTEEEEEEEVEAEDLNDGGSHINDEYNQRDDQGRVLVNVGHASEDPDIFLSPQLAKAIKPHQIGGVRFLYDNLVESLPRFNTSQGFGCILAHSMGLGKTIQVIAFIDIFLRHTSAKRVLCIVPINTLQNWVAEFNMWDPSKEKPPPPTPPPPPKSKDSEKRARDSDKRSMDKRSRDRSKKDKDSSKDSRQGSKDMRNPMLSSGMGPMGPGMGHMGTPGMGHMGGPGMGHMGGHGMSPMSGPGMSAMGGMMGQMGGHMNPMGGMGSMGGPGPMGRPMGQMGGMDPMGNPMGQMGHHGMGPMGGPSMGGPGMGYMGHMGSMGMHNMNYMGGGGGPFMGSMGMPWMSSSMGQNQYGAIHGSPYGPPRPNPMGMGSMGPPAMGSVHMPPPPTSMNQTAGGESSMNPMGMSGAESMNPQPPGSAASSENLGGATAGNPMSAMSAMNPVGGASGNTLNAGNPMSTPPPSSMNSFGNSVNMGNSMSAENPMGTPPPVNQSMPVGGNTMSAPPGRNMMGNMSMDSMGPVPGGGNLMGTGAGSGNSMAIGAGHPMGPGYGGSMGGGHGNYMNPGFGNSMNSSVNPMNSLSAMTPPVGNPLGALSSMNAPRNPLDSPANLNMPPTMHPMSAVSSMTAMETSATSTSSSSSPVASMNSLSSVSSATTSSTCSTTLPATMLQTSTSTESGGDKSAPPTSLSSGDTSTTPSDPQTTSASLSAGNQSPKDGPKSESEAKGEVSADVKTDTKEEKLDRGKEGEESGAVKQEEKKNSKIWPDGIEREEGDTQDLRHRNFKVFLLSENLKTTAQRAKIIGEWKEKGGVLLMGYEMYRLLSSRRSYTPKNKKKKQKKTEEGKDSDVIDVDEEDKNKNLMTDMFGALVNPGPDLVICDEGHRIKNNHASISQSLKQIRTKRRVVLTGYPLQNNLMEYWCMVDFVRPNFLGNKTEFSNMFERPIMNGQCQDSTREDMKIMKHRAYVLHSLLEGFVQRRGHTVLQRALPCKHEYVFLVRMSPIQRKLYRRYIDSLEESTSLAQANSNPLKAFSVGCKIWNHPDILYKSVVLKKPVIEENDLDIESSEVNGGKKKLKKSDSTSSLASTASMSSMVSTMSNSTVASNLSQAAVLPDSASSLSVANCVAASNGASPNLSFVEAANITVADSDACAAGFTACSMNGDVSNRTGINPGMSSAEKTGVFGLETGTSFCSGVDSGTGVSSGVEMDTGAGLGVGSDTSNSNSISSVSTGTGVNSAIPTNTEMTDTSTGLSSNTDTNADVPMDTDASVSAGTETGPGVSSGTGTSTGVSTGTETCTDVSTGTGTSTGVSTGTETGTGVPTGTGTSTGVSTGTETDTGVSTGTGISTGVSTGTETSTGVSTGTETGTGVSTGMGTADTSTGTGIRENGCGTPLLDKKEDEHGWVGDAFDDYESGVLEHGPKMAILGAVIEESLKIGDKILVFSQSLSTLDTIEEFLSKQKVPRPDMEENWSKNRSYFRLDGSTSSTERERLITEFNRPTNNTAWMFLLSTRAGCLGINMIGANRVIVLDASWNPCHDCQAVCRVFRFGQTKQCYVYRLVTENTLERNIYDRQITKQGMSDRVIDEMNPDNHFSRGQMENLLKNEDKDFPYLDFTKCEENYDDPVMVNILKKQGQWMTKEPFNHESLLIDRKELRMSRKEKQQAKEGYARDKRMNITYSRPSYAAYYPGGGGSQMYIRRGPVSRPIASVRPMISSSVARPTVQVVKPGVTVHQVITTTDILLPGTNTATSSGTAEPAGKIASGQKILVIKTPKGVYIRTNDGKMFAVRSKVAGTDDAASTATTTTTAATVAGVNTTTSTTTTTVSSGTRVAISAPPPPRIFFKTPDGKLTEKNPSDVKGGASLLANLYSQTGAANAVFKRNSKGQIMRVLPAAPIRTLTRPRPTIMASAAATGKASKPPVEVIVYPRSKVISTGRACKVLDKAGEPSGKTASTVVVQPQKELTMASVAGSTTVLKRIEPAPPKADSSAKPVENSSKPAKESEVMKLLAADDSTVSKATPMLSVKATEKKVTVTTVKTAMDARKDTSENVEAGHPGHSNDGRAADSAQSSPGAGDANKARSQESTGFVTPAAPPPLATPQTTNIPKADSSSQSIPSTNTASQLVETLLPQSQSMIPAPAQLVSASPQSSQSLPSPSQQGFKKQDAYGANNQQPFNGQPAQQAFGNQPLAQTAGTTPPFASMSSLQQSYQPGQQPMGQQIQSFSSQPSNPAYSHQPPQQLFGSQQSHFSSQPSTQSPHFSSQPSAQLPHFNNQPGSQPPHFNNSPSNQSQNFNNQTSNQPQNFSNLSNNQPQNFNTPPSSQSQNVTNPPSSQLQNFNNPSGNPPQNLNSIASSQPQNFNIPPSSQQPSFSSMATSQAQNFNNSSPFTSHPGQPSYNSPQARSPYTNPSAFGSQPQQSPLPSSHAAQMLNPPQQQQQPVPQQQPAPLPQQPQPQPPEIQVSQPQYSHQRSDYMQTAGHMPPQFHQPWGQQQSSYMAPPSFPDYNPYQQPQQQQQQQQQQQAQPQTQQQPQTHAAAQGQMMGGHGPSQQQQQQQQPSISSFSHPQHQQAGASTSASNSPFGFGPSGQGQGSADSQSQGQGQSEPATVAAARPSAFRPPSGGTDKAKGAEMKSTSTPPVEPQRTAAQPTPPSQTPATQQPPSQPSQTFQPTPTLPQPSQQPLPAAATQPIAHPTPQHPEGRYQDSWWSSSSGLGGGSGGHQGMSGTTPLPSSSSAAPPAASYQSAHSAFTPTNPAYFHPGLSPFSVGAPPQSNFPMMGQGLGMPGSYPFLPSFHPGFMGSPFSHQGLGGAGSGFSGGAGGGPGGYSFGGQGADNVGSFRALLDETQDRSTLPAQPSAGNGMGAGSLVPDVGSSGMGLSTSSHPTSGVESNPSMSGTPLGAGVGGLGIGGGSMNGLAHTPAMSMPPSSSSMYGNSAMSLGYPGLFPMLNPMPNPMFMPMMPSPMMGQHYPMQPSHPPGPLSAMGHMASMGSHMATPAPGLPPPSGGGT